jgi:hypothetical protein
VHVAGRLYQRWAIEQGVFDEVLLFMDCCSTAAKQYPLSYPTFFQAKNLAAVNNTRWFYATASPLALVTREKTTLVGGKAHGVFTATLLDALGGRAGPRVTNEVLGRYLRDNMQAFLDPDDLADDSIAKRPHVDTGPDPFDIVVLDRPAGFDLTIDFHGRALGTPAEIHFGAEIVATTVVSAEPWRVLVPERGMYVLKVGPARTVLEVTRGDLRVDA